MCFSYWNMKTAHISSKHMGVAWRACAAGAVIVIVLLTTDSKCPASPTTSSAPAVFNKPGLPEVTSPDTTGLLRQMLAAIVVITILGILAYIVVKKLLPKIGRATGKRISVLETVYLQPKKALHLIQVGSRKLLVASSPEGLVRLDDVTDAIGPDYAETARRIEDESKYVKASEKKQDIAK